MTTKVEPRFSPDDVWALARAVLEGPVCENVRCRNECQYCGVEAHWQTKPFPHALNCPVRVAQDVLTGAPL